MPPCLPLAPTPPPPRLAHPPAPACPPACPPACCPQWELVRGADLLDFLNAQGGVLPEPLAARLFAQLVRGRGWRGGRRVGSGWGWVAGRRTWGAQRRRCACGRSRAGAAHPPARPALPLAALSGRPPARPAAGHGAAGARRGLCPPRHQARKVRRRAAVAAAGLCTPRGAWRRRGPAASKAGPAWAYQQPALPPPCPPLQRRGGRRRLPASSHDWSHSLPCLRCPPPHPPTRSAMVDAATGRIRLIDFGLSKRHASACTLGE